MVKSLDRESGALRVKKDNAKSMVSLDKFEKFNRLLSGWFEWIGLAGLLVVMFVTCIDVVGAKVFLRPVFGAIDIVMLSQLVAISFATALALILGRHVRVEFFVLMLPRRARAVIDSIISLFGLGLFILIIWRLCVRGYSFQTGREVSATALIPLYPFAYGIALASIPVCLIFLVEFLRSLARIVKK
ncbi:MAG: TRAP transporter small permease [Deltaproteobacteria bacterium]|nr:TRAP transporter small permease [Deltaproteobacteria bacterium]MBW2342056.1 TRAP transporter small permease [Deltaproteobacteria bacterium]